MMYYYGNSFFPYMYGFGILNILFWAVIIYVFVMIFKSSAHHQKKDPIQILKERYAKGEITKEQFESMKKDLQ